jgi:thymidine kinase
MFIEPHLGRPQRDRAGWIEVIAGCMFSGKTEELIRRLNRAIIAKQKVEIFKPVVDTRYHQENIVSHNETAIRSTPVHFASDILLLAGNCDVVGIDEAQFFDEAITEVCNTLANSGKRVIVAGLDMDSALCLFCWLLLNLLQKSMLSAHKPASLHRFPTGWLPTTTSRLC